MKNILLSLILFALAATNYAQTYTWSNVSGAPYSGGKQDGVYFLNKDTGWVVNGAGKIYRTNNGGTNWIQQKNTSGTYFRCVAFKDGQTGFAGNIGINYFPGVTDTNILYKTIDGGNSWASVQANITGTMPAGICAIDVVNSNVIYAGGRVGGPAVLLKSIDGGNNWNGIDLSSYCSMILDVHFQSADTGYVFAGTDANISISNATIIRTTNGGTSWSAVYTSARSNEIIWKAWFPSHQTGYATIQSYDATTTQRYIAKTTNGGISWSELPLVNTGIREFGIGFINDTVGWVGGESTGYETKNGGQTWANKSLGQYANKFSIVKNPTGNNTCYTVGLNVYKLTTGYVGIEEENKKKNDLLVYPNPASSGSYVSIALDQLETKIIKSEMISIDGKTNYTLFDTYYIGTHESPFLFKLPDAAAGEYILNFTGENQKVFSQRIVITK